MFIPQWLARPLGSYELDIIGKLKNWLFLGFFRKFHFWHLEKFRKNLTLPNSRSVHSPMTSTSPGFIWTRYNWKTQKLKFWVFFPDNFIFDNSKIFKKNWNCLFSEVFKSLGLARPLGSFELEIFGKLKNWFILGFYVKFILTLWKISKKSHCPIPEEFILQWLARSLGSFEVNIFWKLKKWASFFPVHFRKFSKRFPTISRAYS